jgi:hypothetical protein
MNGRMMEVKYRPAAHDGEITLLGYANAVCDGLVVQCLPPNSTQNL